MKLKRIGYGRLKWIHLTQNRFHIISCELVMDFRVTYKHKGLRVCLQFERQFVFQEGLCFFKTTHLKKKV